MPDIFMPRLSDTMEEGTLSRWVKKVGDTVEKGDILAEIETDKAVMELESYESGVLSEIIVDEGATVPIGASIARVGSAAQAGPAPGSAPEPEPAAATAESAPAPAPTPAAAAAQPAAAVEIFMPRLSDTMEEGTLSRWIKKVGDTVEKGDILAEIETDKALMELEAYDSGVLTSIVVDEGETVPIGQPIATLGGSGVGGPAVAAHVPGSAVPGAPTMAEPSAAVAPASRGPGAGATDGRRIKASPMARAVARDLGIDLSSVTGTGPGGRVVRADVEAASSAAPPAPTAPSAAAAAPTAPVAAAAEPAQMPDVEEVPLSNIRKVTARRLTESMQNAPHFYLTGVVDADPLVTFRTDLNSRLAAADVGVKISVNDLLVKACATTLRANPALNVSFAGDRILKHRRVNVGIAVAVESGLIVPVIKDADQKSVTAIAAEAKALAAKARESKLKPDEFTGGTFTVSNLGMFGVSHFTAVINPPEAAILAVGGTFPEAAVRDGEIVVRNTMRITLSIDHRAVDGATGAQFLQQLTAILEEPLRILA